VTDWVLVQLRETATGAAVVSKSVLLHKSGNLVDDDGVTTQFSLNVPENSYYFIIRHRNHLAVMSADVVPLNASTSSLYDFTTGEDKYWGLDAKDFGNNVYGMYSADVTGDGVISLAAELTQIRADNLKAGYYSADVNMDGIISLAAELTKVRANNLKGTNLP
jgi:hypothetical protein